MSKTSSIIEINGHRYDATTGQMLGMVRHSATQIKNNASGVIDGVVRQPATNVTRSSIHHASSASKRIKQTAQTIHKKTERSRTLMRSGVKKPQSKKPTAVATKAVPASSYHRHLTPNQSVAHPTQTAAVAINNQVVRFGHVGLKPKANSKQVHHGEIVRRPKPTAGKTSSANLGAKPMPSMVASASHLELERMLDHALTTADAHKQTHAYKARKTLGWPLIIAGFFILAAIVFILLIKNVPAIAMKVVATRAHINASVPAYAPQGYSYSSPIQYDNKAVTLRYEASSDSAKSYAISQEKSDWDSITLASNALAGKSQVQTSQINGTTVYIYGAGNDATWVNHGIRYTLNDNANLESDQILKIASSL